MTQKQDQGGAELSKKYETNLSKHIHPINNPSGHIESRCVRNFISKFQGILTGHQVGIDVLSRGLRNKIKMGLSSLRNTKLIPLNIDI